MSNDLASQRLCAKDICDIMAKGAKAGVVRIQIGDILIDFMPIFDPPVPREQQSTDLADEVQRAILRDQKMQELDLHDPLEYEKTVFDEDEG